MRDTTVRQDRVPRNWDALSADCNMKIDTVKGVVDNGSKSVGMALFVAFLDGRTYASLSEENGMTVYAVRTAVKKAYSSVRHACSAMTR